LDNINIHRVLIAPLDWGLGHATRCIPIIKAFQALHYEVILAGDGAVSKLLATEFPEIRILHLKGYQIQYANSSKALVWKLLSQVPKILRTIKEEHEWLEEIKVSEKIDMVVSDNRYGLYTQKIPCIFITHQLCIKTAFPFLEELLRKLHYRFIDRFTNCWVPDAAGEINLGGQLSHPRTLPRIPTHYLGILSRMTQNEVSEKQFNYCFLLSGPEPQRSILEDKMLDAASKLPGRNLLVRGLPASNNTITVPENCTVYNHLPTKDLLVIIASSELIICRSGYTSLMELIGLKKDALLIPTPGQTEQEYLAKKLVADQRFSMAKQDAPDLLVALHEAKTKTYHYQTIPVFTTKTLEALLIAL
jgi:uncharacterized protein (TIGR00661 family)